MPLIAAEGRPAEGMPEAPPEAEAEETPEATASEELPAGAARTETESCQ